MPEAKRTQLKKKIEAGEARNKAKTRAEPSLIDRTGERAVEAKDKFTAFAKEHPIATVAGGLALGILISGLFRRSPRFEPNATTRGACTCDAWYQRAK